MKGGSGVWAAAVDSDGRRRRRGRTSFPWTSPTTAAACATDGQRNGIATPRNSHAAPLGNSNPTYSRCPPSNQLKI